ncbi:MAG TPA: amidohydrolase family protein [Mycobacteriales bacterium]|nr:amidohydrolase family protein [Mycobacteriales bacterium]
MAFHLRGTLLPGGEIRELWALGDRITFTRPAGEHETVAGWGWVLPGLVDAHTHPGHGADRTFDQAVFRARFRAQFRAECRAHAESGVSAVRVPGSRRRVPGALLDDPDLPRVIVAGRWLAWAGLREVDSAAHHRVDDLVAAAVAEATASGGWCKVVADWEPFSPAVPEDLLATAVDAVHRAGGRVAVHCQTAAGCRAAVLSGADSVEHGMHLDPGLLDLMARHGTALVPTLDVFASDIARVRAQPAGPRRDWYLDGFAGLLATTRAAHESGVAVYAGTDSVGGIRFGNVAGEVEWLVRAGVPAADAVAGASWRAREWLGLPGLVEGGPADLVVYDADPRVDISTLRRPRRIVLRGRIVR